MRSVYSLGSQPRTLTRHCYRTFEIQAGRHTITAADLLPADLPAALGPP